MNEETKKVSFLMTWDDAIKRVEQETMLCSPFFIVEPGKPRVVAIVGDPFCYEGVYLDGKWCGYNQNDERHNGVVPALRIALACYLRDLSQVRVMEMGVVFFRDVLKMREKYGLDNWWFEIINHETDLHEPDPLMSILPEEKLTPDDKAKIGCGGMPVISSLYTFREE
jgi:hypothetical protein